MTVRNNQFTYVALAIGIAAIAIALRVYPFRDSFFPLNDGGLFLAFIDHIGAGLYFSKTCVVYNGDCVPFAYPPLSFFLASLLSSLGLSSIEISVVYPLGVSILTMLPIFLLVREVSDNKTIQLLAFAAMLLQVKSIEYTLMGGGISRATGALFFIVALVAACRLAKTVSWRPLVICALAVAAAALSHLEWGINTALGTTILILLCSKAPVRSRIATVLTVGVISFVVTAPWIIWVLSVHGLDPFTSASATANWETSRIMGLFKLEFFPRMTGVICAVGVLAMARQGNYAWIIMLMIFYLATPRHFQNVAVFPVAVLAAHGIFLIVEQVWGRLGRYMRLPSMALATTGTIVVFAIGLAAIQVVVIKNRDTFSQVSPDVLSAANWASATLTPDATSVILSNRPWYIDRDAEWWPYLTGHTNLNTVQGSEWLPGGVFRERLGFAGSLLWVTNCDQLLPRLHNLAELDYVLVFENAVCFEEDTAFEKAFETQTVRVFTTLP